MDASKDARPKFRPQQGSSEDGPDPFCEKNYLCFAKMNFIFGWVPYTSYSNHMSIML